MNVFNLFTKEIHFTVEYMFSPHYSERFLMKKIILAALSFYLLAFIVPQAYSQEGVLYDASSNAYYSVAEVDPSHNSIFSQSHPMKMSTIKVEQETFDEYQAPIQAAPIGYANPSYYSPAAYNAPSYPYPGYYNPQPQQYYPQPAPVSPVAAGPYTVKHYTQPGFKGDAYVSHNDSQIKVYGMADGRYPVAYPPMAAPAYAYAPQYGYAGGGYGASQAYGAPVSSYATQEEPICNCGRSARPHRHKSRVVDVPGQPYYFLPNTQPAREIVTDKGWVMKRVGRSELGTLGRQKLYVAGRDNKNQLKVFIDGIHAEQTMQQVEYNQGLTPKASQIMIEQQPADGSSDWEEINVDLAPTGEDENVIIDTQSS
jgi:hypothetical protein